MAAFIRCVRADFAKFRRSHMAPIHIFIPLIAAALFLLYYSVSPWKAESKISGYLEAVGIAFPLIIGLVTSKAAEQEAQAGSFQAILCVKSRAAVYAGKLAALLLFGILSVALAIGVFAIGFKTAPAGFYLKAAAVVLAGGFFLYILHLFLSLEFGRGASIGLGIVESLISALALTGLGDGKWYFVPCTWSARLCDCLVYIETNPAHAAFGYTEIDKALLIDAAATVIAFFASLFWFRSWEGRKTYD